MGWKFWEKATDDKAGPKLPKPRELPSGVGRYLVVNLKHDPDWVWALRSVSRPLDGSKSRFEVRVYDDVLSREAGVVVKNYLTLDDHPELILFDGVYDKTTWKVEIAERPRALRQPAA